MGSFKYYFKISDRIADEVREDVVVSMKDMLGNKGAATQRVSAA